MVPMPQFPPMPMTYGADPLQVPMQQYYYMPPQPYHMSGQFMIPPMELQMGQAGRPPLRCWGCCMAGHLQRDCTTHPPVAARPPQQVRRPAVAQPAAPVMGAAAAGAMPPQGHMMPWGLPPQPPAPPGAGPRYAQAAMAMGQARAPAPPAKQLPQGQAAPLGQGGMVLMALGTGGASTTSNGDWIIDSGAFYHMAPTADKLDNLRNIDPLRMTMAGGQTVSVSWARDAVTTLNGESGPFPVALYDVLVVPGLAVNLFSVRDMTDKGYGAFFHQIGMDVVNIAGVVFRGEERGNVCVLPTTTVSARTDGSNLGTAALAASAPVWHARLAHAGTAAVMQIAATVDGMTIQSKHPRKNLTAICDPCISGKQTRVPFPT